MKNYVVIFKSLRSETSYSVNIGGGSGDPIQLKGGASPFLTQEDDDEDMFIPVRTQTGYISIIDDGRDYNGHIIDEEAGRNWWRDLMPQTDTSRPVTLTDGNGTVLWQGFMQAQNFSGTLFEDTQERRFPVQCVLSVLNGIDVPVVLPSGLDMILNFASLLSYIFGNIPTVSGNMLSNGNFIFQGSSRARTILSAKLDWSNFLTTDDDGNAAAAYNLYDVLTDFCRFWGYTCRTHHKDVVFVCADDNTATDCITFTATGLPSILGTVSSQMFASVDIPDSFVSVDNDDIAVLGPGKAEVKVDTNSQQEIVEFAPVEVEKTMEAGGYTWVSGDDPLVGYFTTPTIYNFDATTLKGTGKFCRRQIYTTRDQADGDYADLIMIEDYRGGAGITPARLQTKVPRSYGGGTIRMQAQFYYGAEVCELKEIDSMWMRLGIGMTRDTAKWFYIYTGVTLSRISSGWTERLNGEIPQFRVKMGANLQPGVVVLSPAGYGWFSAVPVEDNLYGYLFIEFEGCDGVGGLEHFEIANFSLEFSRENTVIPTDWGEATRARTMTQKRQDTIKYTAKNNNGNLNIWNANCIFATDNNAEYGYGLLMTADGGYFGKMSFGGVEKFPEQHLADRVAAYWATSKRMVIGELDDDDNIVKEISPRHVTRLDGSTFYPIAIAHDWRDEKKVFTLIEI